MSEDVVSGHNGCVIALVVVTVLVYIITLIFNGFAGAGDNDLFDQSIGVVSDNYPLEITPSDWAFNIWFAIFVWIALWLLYELTTICRKDKTGTYIYRLNVTPPGVFVAFIVNNLLLIGWLFAFDREEFIASLVIIVLVLITLICSLAFSYIYLHRRVERLRVMEMGKEIWFVRILLQNGLSFYAGWVFVATLLNLSIVMAYDGVVSQDWSSTISLIIFSILVVVYFVLDLSIFAKYTFYTFATYIPLLIALAGALSNNFDLDTARRNTIFTLILISVTGLLIIAKAVVITIHLCKKITKNSVV